MKSPLSHKLKQYKDVKIKWNIPFVTENCGVNSSDGREAESIANLFMLRYLTAYLPIHLFQPIYFIALGRCLYLGADAGSTAHLSHGVCFSSWTKGAGVELHLPHYSASHTWLLILRFQLLKTNKGKYDNVHYSII